MRKEKGARAGALDVLLENHIADSLHSIAQELSVG